MSSDEGSLAGTTLLSTRTKQDLKEVPVSIDALTKKFLLNVGPAMRSHLRSGLRMQGMRPPLAR